MEVMLFAFLDLTFILRRCRLNFSLCVSFLTSRPGTPAGRPMVLLAGFYATRTFPKPVLIFLIWFCCCVLPNVEILRSTNVHAERASASLAPPGNGVYLSSSHPQPPAICFDFAALVWIAPPLGG